MEEPRAPGQSKLTTSAQPELLWAVHHLPCLCSHTVVSRKIIAAYAVEQQFPTGRDPISRSYYVPIAFSVSQCNKPVPAPVWPHLAPILSSTHSTYSPPHPFASSWGKGRMLQLVLRALPWPAAGQAEQLGVLIASHSLSYREDTNGSLLQPLVCLKLLIQTGRQKKLGKKN